MSIKTRLAKLEQRRDKARPRVPLLVWRGDPPSPWPEPTAAEIEQAAFVAHIHFEDVKEPAHVH